MKAVLKANLVESKILPEVQKTLTSKQQKELLMLEHDKCKLQVEIKKDLAVEKMRHELEQTRLQLIKER